MSLLQRGGQEGEMVRARLRQLPPDDVATTIVSYEEQTRGWIDNAGRSSTMQAQIANYSRLKRHMLNYCQIAVVDFDERAGRELERLRKARIRISTMDLKIAAIALANDATLLTRNLSDFGKVPGLRAEDWTT
jgi:tRNA(fMet)-specific endonuclease VapC